MPQLATDEVPPLAGGIEQDSLRPERREENVETDHDWREKRKQAQPRDLQISANYQLIPKIIHLRPCQCEALETEFSNFGGDSHNLPQGENVS